jgi:hypothetical protein
MISPEFYTVQDEVQGLALHPKWCRARPLFKKEVGIEFFSLVVGESAIEHCVRIEYELSDYIQFVNSKS